MKNRVIKKVYVYKIKKRKENQQYILMNIYKKQKKNGTCQCNFPVVSPGNTSQHLKVANALIAHHKGAFIQ